MKRLLIVLLVAALLLPCLLSGCNSSKKQEEETTTQTTTNKPEDTSSNIPEDTTTPEPIELTLTTVNVITGKDMTEIYAGAEMLAYLQKKGVSYAADGFPISISIDPSIEMDGFIIEATLSGDNIGMTVKGGNGRGALYGVYRFLEKYAGFRYLAPGLETQTEDAIVIPEGIVMEYAPQILSRRMCWYSVSGQVD